MYKGVKIKFLLDYHKKIAVVQAQYNELSCNGLPTLKAQALVIVFSADNTIQLVVGTQ